MRVQAPQSEAHIAAMFDRVAPRYDLLNRLLSARQDQRWRRRLTKMIPFRPEGRYLDVATGTGDVLVAAAHAHDEYGAFVGVDISSEMLVRAEEKARQHGIKGKTEFRRLNAENLAPLASESFDCLSISFGLRNVVRREAALKEFHRVLAPGGVMLILEFFLPKKGLLARLFQLYFHGFLPLVGGLLSDKAAYRYLPESVGSFYEAAALREVLYKIGFKVDQEVSFLFGSCRLVRAVKL